jgi:hypothetical protein
VRWRSVTGTFLAALPNAGTPSPHRSRRIGGSLRETRY